MFQVYIFADVHFPSSGLLCAMFKNSPKTKRNIFALGFIQLSHEIEREKNRYRNVCECCCCFFILWWKSVKHNGISMLSSFLSFYLSVFPFVFFSTFNFSFGIFILFRIFSVEYFRHFSATLLAQKKPLPYLHIQFACILFWLNGNSMPHLVFLTLHAGETMSMTWFLFHIPYHSCTFSRSLYSWPAHFYFRFKILLLFSQYMLWCIQGVHEDFSCNIFSNRGKQI